MFINLLKITLRNLAKNRSYLFVNVLGHPPGEHAPAKRAGGGAVHHFPTAVLEHVVLANYANRITVGVPVFLITFSAAVGIALLTVGYRSLLAATQNPASSLRTE
jgi:hypothetical protein